MIEQNSRKHLNNSTKMSTEEALSSLLNRLSISDDKVQTLEELKTLISVLPNRELRDVIPNISIGYVFECLNTSDRSQQAICGEILNSLLSNLSASTVLENFHHYLLAWLDITEDSVRTSCLNQISRLSRESPSDLSRQEALVLSVVERLSSDSMEVGLAACKALTHLGKDPDGLKTLFSNAVVEQIVSCMQKNDTVRFRVYQMAIDLSCISSQALASCSGSGLLQQLMNETLSDGDILVQLNAIELVSDLARCPHGLSFLDSQGVVNKMEALIQGLGGNPMAGILVPGLIKFYGGLAKTHPKEVLSKFSPFVRIVFDSISDNDPSLNVIAMDTVGFIASSPEGKLALDRLGNPMTECVRAIGRTVKRGTSTGKGAALEAIASLTLLQVEHQTTELLSVTERWFEATSPDDSFNALWSIAQQPFADLRVPALHALHSLASTPWGQRLMNGSPGFKEYLLDRGTESTKEGKEEKYKVVKIIAESPTCIEVLGRPYYVKLKEFVNEGPFFVMAQSEVAMDGQS